MCCGGTVATTCASPSASKPIVAASRRALCALLARTADQVFGFAFGWPVLPEVKPIATTCSPSMSGTVTSARNWSSSSRR